LAVGGILASFISGVRVALELLFDVPEEVVLRQEERGAQSQELPALYERALLRWAAAGLLHELAVDLALQLGVNQANLQGRLGQRHVVVHRGCFHGHVDEELAGLAGQGWWARADPRPLG